MTRFKCSHSGFRRVFSFPPEANTAVVLMRVLGGSQGRKFAAELRDLCASVIAINTYLHPPAPYTHNYTHTVLVPAFAPTRRVCRHAGQREVRRPSASWLREVAGWVVGELPETHMSATRGLESAESRRTCLLWSDRQPPVLPRPSKTNLLSSLETWHCLQTTARGKMINLEIVSFNFGAGINLTSNQSLSSLASGQIFYHKSNPAMILGYCMFFAYRPETCM